MRKNDFSIISQKSTKPQIFVIFIHANLLELCPVKFFVTFNFLNNDVRCNAYSHTQVLKTIQQQVCMVLGVALVLMLMELFSWTLV